MLSACSIDPLKNSHEVVICDSATARSAHKELYHFKDEVYVTPDNETDIFEAVAGIVNSCNTSPSDCPSKIHIALGWESIMKTALWKHGQPVNGEVLILLRNAGLGSVELQPFRTADINDLFPWLYYGKRFDILRKVCHATKKQMESHLKDHTIRVDCHLVAQETKKIVASSL
jgi:hypothetical protein